jgi:hypothetical protein
MTAVDLCAMYNPWHIQENIVSTIMDEFWQEVWVFFFKYILLLISSNELTHNNIEREQKRDVFYDILFFVLI